MVVYGINYLINLNCAIKFNINVTEYVHKSRSDDFVCAIWRRPNGNSLICFSIFNSRFQNRGLINALKHISILDAPNRFDTEKKGENNNCCSVPCCSAEYLYFIYFLSIGSDYYSYQQLKHFYNTDLRLNYNIPFKDGFVVILFAVAGTVLIFFFSFINRWGFYWKITTIYYVCLIFCCICLVFMFIFSLYNV